MAAAARPIPLPAPVTMATCPPSLPAGSGFDFDVAFASGPGDLTVKV
jgi:hypothetical protein